MYRLALVLQSRRPNPLRPDLKGSPVWGDINNGVEFAVKKYGPQVECIVLNDEKVYSSIDSAIDRYGIAVKLKVHGIIGPLAMENESDQERALSVLRPYKGKIVVINSGPSEAIVHGLGSILVGSVGPDERKMGWTLANEIFYALKRKGVNLKGVDVRIYDDKFGRHVGYRQREEEIIKVAQLYGVRSVTIVPINLEDEKTFLIEPDTNTILFGLGPMGTKVSLKIKQRYPDKIIGIATMDMDQDTRDAILSGDVHCSVLQNPFEQGVKAVDMMMTALTGKATSAYSTLHCKVRVADKNNVGLIK